MSILLSPVDAGRTEAAVLDFERNPRKPGRRDGRGGGNRPPIRAILLADLVDGGEADCAVTVQDETTWIQEVEILGDVGGGTFALTFKGQTTSALPFNATPSQMQNALTALSTIGANNCVVRMGKQTYHNAGANTDVSASPGVWLVEFVGTFALSTTSPPLMTVTNSLTGPGQPQGQTTGLNAMAVNATTHWVDSGVVETANAVIPVGVPTPMRDGAVIVCIFFPGVGYGVIACEPREFSQTYY